MHESDACMETSRPSFDPQPIMFSVDALPRDLHIHCRSNMWYLKEAVVLQKSYWFCLECSFFFPFLCFTSKWSWNYHKLNLWVFHYRSWTFDIYYYYLFYFIWWTLSKNVIPSIFHRYAQGCWSQSAANLPHLQSKDMHVRQSGRVPTQTQREHANATNKPLAWESNQWPSDCKGSWCHFKLKCQMKFSKHKSVWNISHFLF